MIFSDLKVSVEEACTVSINKGAFSLAVVSAFSKSLGLVLEIEKDSFDNKYFWIAPTLRSICEDLIVLGFLDKNFKGKSDEIIKLQLSLGMHKSLQAQEALFSEYRPHQPRIRPKGTVKSISEAENKLKTIFSSYVKGKHQTQPSVRQMAKDQGMLLLYDFLYHATSRLVHYSPNTLLRMAWFEPEVNLSKCDPAALDKYYQQFVKFYSAHLLSTFTARFSSVIDQDENLTCAIAKNLEDVNSNPRWPELVTFEEFNAENPWENEKTMRQMSFWNILIKDPGMVFEAKC